MSTYGPTLSLHDALPIGRHVDLGAEQRADLVGVAAGQALELTEREPARVAAHPALGSAEGQVEDGGLEGHRRGEGLDLVGVDVGVEADPALARAAGGVVVHAPAGEHLDGAVVHPHRSEEHTSELQSLMRISYAVFCLKKKRKPKINRDLAVTG